MRKSLKNQWDITELSFTNLDEPEIHQPLKGEHYDQVCLQ
jgi:hypothetical protein